ncbi:MAG: hypothetical protein U0573_15415 [Phycisphaerales bacterium]|nr:hypothetical protein [Planctomycetota bacterium]
MHEGRHANSDRELSPRARERRDSMLPELLAEVRRVRRRRTVARAASISSALALLAGVLALALLRVPGFSGDRPVAKLTTPLSPPEARGAQAQDRRVQIEIIRSSPDILERYAIRDPSIVRVEYINTEQALALLESGGERYSIVEIAGRVEFQPVAKR